MKCIRRKVTRRSPWIIWPNKIISASGEHGGAVKAFPLRNFCEVPLDLPPAVDKQSTRQRQMCVPGKKNTPVWKPLHKTPSLSFPSFSPPLSFPARLPAISHRHQALWWSTPCVLMLRVHDRLQSNTSSLADSSSKLWNHGHNEWSRVFCYPCMDGPVHAALPNPTEETVQIYTCLSKWDTFWLKILVFLQSRWSFYVNNVHP